MGHKAPHSFHMNLGCTSGDLADSTTYYTGGKTIYPLTSENDLIYIPRTGIIREAILSIWVAGVDPTAENTTFKLRKNGADVYTLYTGTISGKTTGYLKLATISNLNVAVTQGDYITISITTPAYVTNPTGVRINLELLVDYA